MFVRLAIGCVLCVLASSNDLVQAEFSVYQTTEKIISDGFPSETHNVTTSDGYILEMHRIPHGRSTQDVDEDRTVVFLMHGFTAASNSFIALDAEHSIAYNLADAGFDVWMGNARGNKNSRYHVSLDPDHEEEKFLFFDFSFEEIGMLDLPAMIDYVLAHTGMDNLHYIGHSQGGTVFLVLASMLPEYNQKISSAHLLAAVGYQGYFPDEELLQLASLTDFIYGMALSNGIVELYPPNSTEMVPGDILPLPYQATVYDYCAGDLNKRHMCQLFGIQRIMREGAPTDQPGAAIKQLAHFGQNIRDKLFRRFHYGSAVNPSVYGTAEPPLYDLSLITTFVTMHYSLSDILLDERDVVAMVADMPRAIARRVARTTFLHEDYLIALDSKELVTDYIIEAITNERQEDHYTGNDVVNVVHNNTDSPSTVPVDVDDPTDSVGNPIETVVNPIDIVDLDAPTTDSAAALNTVINVYLLLLAQYLILK